MIKYTIKDLLDAIDKGSYKKVRTILSELKKGAYLNLNNALIRSIRSVLSSSNLRAFSLRIIVLLFEYGAKCFCECTSDTLECVYTSNALNTGIICANSYMGLFKKCEDKLIAEKNALSVLDVLINNGAIPRNTYQNTLSIVMDTKNLKILRFITGTNICLRPNNDHDIYNTFECALDASQKTGQSEFLEIALGRGAIPRSPENIFASRKLQDCIVFGGNHIIQYFHAFIDDLIKELCATKALNDNEMIHSLELIVCASGSVTMSKDYFCWKKRVRHFGSGRNRILLEKIFTDYDALWSGRYLIHDKNDDRDYFDQYNRIVELKRRLSARTQIITNKRNERKIEIDDVINGLPTCCIDIIYGYDGSYPKLDVIDWSKY